MRTPAPPAEPVVAVVGATGLVGEVLLRVLAERRFPVSELRLLAGPRSAGRRVRALGRDLVVAEAVPAALDGVDLVFFAATGALSRTLAPEAVRRGALVVDKSATWRLDPEVPLVVPEVNARAIERSAGIVACPNCTTIGLVLALEPLRRAAGLEEVVVTTLQAASGAGRGALEAFEGEERALAAGEEPAAGPTERLARNVVPVCDAIGADGASAEEHKLLAETRKILGEPALRIEATCVRVPVPVGHAASVLVRTRRPIGPDEACAALESAPGVRLVDVPTPAAAAGTDLCLVGRVRAALAGPGIQLFQVADNLRKGAATNAVQIAELLRISGRRGAARPCR
jgi:aspartate-semialdehyde dehydrogenase